MKKTTNHDIYEIWNEWAAESVYCIGKPTLPILRNIVLKQWIIKKWKEEDFSREHGSLENYIKQYIRPYKLKPVYSSNE